MKRTIFFVFIVFVIGRSLVPNPASAQPQDVLAFRLIRGYLVVVPCSVGGQSNLTAVIDSGTTETVLNLELARQLALPARPDSATSLNIASSAFAVPIPDLRLGPLEFKHLDGIALDVSHVASRLGFRPDLVIGMDVLHRQNFTIDYSSRLLLFSAFPRLTHTVPLYPSSRFVLLDSIVLGQSVTLKLDTGFNSLLLYGNRIGGLAQLISSRAVAATVTGAIDASVARTVKAAEVQVGDWRSTRLSVAIIASGPADVNFYDGLLGPAALGAKRMTFDFAHHQLSWE